MAADIAQVKSAADRAAELTRQLLTFSRKQVLLPRVVDIVSLVSGIEAMLRRVIGEDVDVTTDLSPDTGRVMADPGQIEQVLMNLAVNARDAMPRGGSLRIQTSNHAASGHGVAEFPAAGRRGVRAPAGERHGARHGPGDAHDGSSSRSSPPRGRARAPGLGLSTVYGIVSQSGGRIYCTSAPDEGTVFTIFFPRLSGRCGMRHRPPPRRGPRAAPKGCCWWRTNQPFGAMRGGCWKKADTRCWRHPAGSGQWRSPRRIRGASTSCSPTW